jgi:hypothetical protein
VTTDPACGTPHPDYPETACTEPPRHRLPHAGPLIIGGEQCGAAAWGADHGHAGEPEGEQPAPPPDTTVTLTVHVTAPGADAAHHAQTIADLVQAEYGDSMRLRTAITTPDYTPPPPGSDRDALPEHLRALIAPHMRPYTSTACETARACRLAAEVHHDHADELRTWEQRQHAACRITRKQDMARCTCDCHTTPKETRP